MDKDSNLKHWDGWAEKFGSSLSATTKCATIKRIEVVALAKHLKNHLPDGGKILEVGCGNGINMFQLSSLLPGHEFHGLDFSQKMIENALAQRDSREYSESKGRLHFGVLDARQLAAPLRFSDGTTVEDAFDVIYTNRMLINLASQEEQLEVMRKISEMVKPGGLFLMMENSVQSHARINEIRVALGLPVRERASYNIFIDEKNVIDVFKNTMSLADTEYISGLHDLILYAVAPAAADGNIEYDTPLMKALTDAILYMDEAGMPMPRGLGQGVLWVWRRSPSGPGTAKSK